MSEAVQRPDILLWLFKQPGFFRDLEPIQGAAEGLKAFVEAGHDVVIASTPCTSHSAAEKIEWCEHHLPFIPKKNIVIVHRKELIPGDVFIDDSLANVETYLQAHPNAKALTLAYEYNRNDPCPYHLRTTNWADIVEFVGAL